MRILVTGGNGMLGGMFTNVAIEKGYEVVSLGRDELDITNLVQIKNYLKDNIFNVLVNCAAYTNVEAAEDNVDLCNLVNASAPGYLAEASREAGIHFIHISTDYVFNENNTDGYNEDHDPGENQSNVYGKSKRLGEINVIDYNPDSYIVRTSWVFGPNGKNFIDTMLSLSEARSELTIVDDEYGVPTYTKDISNQLIYIIEHTNSLSPGIYHAVSEGICSRYEQADVIFNLIGKLMKINRTKLKDYPRKAKVPEYSKLLNTKLPKLQSWKDSIKEYLRRKKYNFNHKI